MTYLLIHLLHTNKSKPTPPQPSPKTNCEVKGGKIPFQTVKGGAQILYRIRYTNVDGESHGHYCALEASLPAVRPPSPAAPWEKHCLRRG